MVACQRWLGMISIQKCCGVTRQFFSSSSLFLGTSRTVGGPFFAPVVQDLSIPCRAAWFRMCCMAQSRASRVDGAMCSTSNCCWSCRSASVRCSIPTRHTAAIFPMFLSQPSNTHWGVHFSRKARTHCSQAYQGAIMCCVRQHWRAQDRRDRVGSEEVLLCRGGGRPASPPLPPAPLHPPAPPHPLAPLHPPAPLGCSVLGRGAEPLVRTQFLEHPPTLNFGANHLKEWIQHPQKPPIPFLSPHNPHCRGGFLGGGQRVRAQLEQS